VVVLSGSLPPGVPEDGYAALTEAARHSGRASVIVDAGGAALRLACAAGPDVVKPNESELMAASSDGAKAHAGLDAGSRAGAGRAVRVLAAAESLRRLGASAVVASLGRTGSVAVTPAGRWRVRHPQLDGNPVGAGDALVAGLALQAAVLGTADWTAADWAAALARASGMAAASVLSPSAGEADPAEATRLAQSVRIRKMGQART
jgi:fructose-1-phosphate kinase PfkB-like protein